ncbi:MAG: phytanoyl-CoA dioxygenase family protein [Planctomycetes bacterium]|nr:phytanoyl-CoA dioxygenase family protein [Planctomycetota bacterium]
MNDKTFTYYDQHDSAGIVRGIKDDGIALIPKVLDAEKSQEICAHIDAYSAAPSSDDDKAAEFESYNQLFNRDPYWLQFLDYAGIIEAVEELMGSDSHIIGMSALKTAPGLGRFGDFHIDQLFIPMDEKFLISGDVELPVFISTLHFYLTDIDEDLCPTWVIPGSHKSGRAPGGAGNALSRDTQIGTESTWNNIDAHPVLVKAGDCMLFRSEVWHAGSKNKTNDRTRYVLQVHYAQRSVAQRFSPYLHFQHNPTVLAVANERQLRLLGKHHISAYG